MSTSEIISIVALAVTISGIVYAFGERDNRLKVLEKDLNNLGSKHSEKLNEIEKVLKRFDERLDRNNEFRLLADQRVSYLEERFLGEETAGRLRGLPQSPSVPKSDWFSDNSGIDM